MEKKYLLSIWHIHATVVLERNQKTAHERKLCMVTMKVN